MTDNIDVNNSKIVIDQDVGSGGTYSINGHNNSIKVVGVEVRKITIMGHNNVVKGTEDYETIKKLVVLGHNNVINQLSIKDLEICGHNNNFKHLVLTKQPVNNGFQNKIQAMFVNDSGNEQAEYEQSVQFEQVSDDDSSDESDSIDSEMDQNSFQTNIQADVMQNININLGNGLEGITANLPEQINQILSGINISSNVNGATFDVYNYEQNDSSDEDDDSEYGEIDDEEQKYTEYDVIDDEEEQDEESHISPEERANIINSIQSTPYGGKEDENCAICLSHLTQKQHVKKLPCGHIFHPK